MTTAPATGETLTVKRDVPITQGTDYVENDSFPAESHEQALDKITMIVQQQQEELDRTLKLTESQTSTGLTVAAPVDTLFLQWDADGNLQNKDIAEQGALAVSEFAKTYLDDIDAATTRATLGAAAKPSSAVTGNLAKFDAEDETEDSGISFKSVPLSADAGGTADAITVTFSPALAALDDNRLVIVRAAGANVTTTPTFAPDGLTAKTIAKHGNQALAVGDIFGADHELLLAYNSTNDNWELLNPATVASALSMDNFFHAQDQKSSGTDGGTFTSGSFLIRTLNTVVTNTISGASLAANIITLPAGTYYIEASAPANQVNRHKAKLENHTDTADLLIGSSQYATGGTTVVSTSNVSGLFTLASGKGVKITHQCQTTKATDGLGIDNAFGVIEIYTDVRIWKV
jgi:hypothetical protein